MQNCFFCCLQGRNEDSNVSSAWCGLHDGQIFQIFIAVEYKIDTSCLPACSKSEVIAMLVFSVKFATFPFKSLLFSSLFAFAVGNICNVKSEFNTRFCCSGK